MTSSTALDRMPDLELMGNVLDLGRPELAPLMNRYSRQPSPAQARFLAPRTALIVTRRPGEELPLRAALEKDGWVPKTCAGPGDGGCPMMRAERCELRESVDAAVVFVEPREPFGSLGTIPRLRCAGDSSSPGVVAVEGSFDQTRFSERTATVGSLRGPGAIIDAITALVASQHERA